MCSVNGIEAVIREIADRQLNMVGKPSRDGALVALHHAGRRSVNIRQVAADGPCDSDYLNRKWFARQAPGWSWRMETESNGDYLFELSHGRHVSRSIAGSLAPGKAPSL